VPEPELGQIQRVNEAVDSPNRIVRLDVVLDPRWKQAGLLAALAALERAILISRIVYSTPKNARYSCPVSSGKPVGLLDAI
jgi:hypothetical protein